MLPNTHLLAFALTSFVLIAIPGPSVLFTISRALTVGRPGALLTVLGNAAGVYLQAVAVALGIGTVVTRSVEVFTVVKLLGAGYLVFLGVQAIRHRHSLTEAMGRQMTAVRTRRMLLDGFVVGAANPKTIVFFVAVLPQFVDRAAGEVSLQMLLLGSLFPLIAVASDSVWVLVAGTARTWLARSPRRLAAIGGAGGLAMIGIGANLAVTGRRD